MSMPTFLSWSLLPVSPLSTICTRAGWPSRVCTLWSSESFFSSFPFFPMFFSEKGFKKYKYEVEHAPLSTKGTVLCVCMTLCFFSVLSLCTIVPFLTHCGSLVCLMPHKDHTGIGNCGGILVAAKVNGKPGREQQGRPGSLGSQNLSNPHHLLTNNHCLTLLKTFFFR